MKGLLLLLSIIISPQSDTPPKCIKGNCKMGTGTLLYQDGSTYSGQFHRGIPHGKGIIKMSNGDQYEGTLLRGKKSGEGKYQFKNGNRYIGKFKNDQIEGKGRMDYASGDIYKGSWKENSKHGRGTLEKSDGQVIEGIWRNGRLIKQWEIEGKEESIVTSHKRKYKDCNRNHCHRETGRYTYRDGSYFIGDFINGYPEGQGICYYANGDIYKGSWQNHSPNGEGIITFSNGRKFKAIWSNGKPVEELYAGAEFPISGKNKRRRSADGKLDMYAMVIGISSYNHLPALKYTDDDAYQLYAFLKSPEGGALPDQNISLLIDEAATSKNIRARLDDILSKADEDDIVILYYSGHGLQGRILPIDFDGYNNSIAHEELYEMMDQSMAKHKVLIADACFAGSMENDKSGIDHSLRTFYDKMKNANGGTAVLMSSKAEEKSLEYSGLRQGVFSHFLLRGLKGEADHNDDAMVSIDELYQFIHSEVKKYTDNKQSPTIYGNYDKELPLAMVRVP